MEIANLPKRLHCNKCGHEWIPRQEEVFVCPRCKNPRWKSSKQFEVVKIEKDEPFLKSLGKLEKSRIFREEMLEIGAM